MALNQHEVPPGRVVETLRANHLRLGRSTKHIQVLDPEKNDLLTIVDYMQLGYLLDI